MVTGVLPSPHRYVPSFLPHTGFRNPTAHQFLSGRCSVTIFLTGLDGTVTQHDGTFLAVDGFPFLTVTFLAVDGKKKFDGIFTAVTQHDGTILAVDGFRFLTVSFGR